MKTFQQKILICLAICLCGLCVYQWYVQSAQYVAIEKLEQIVAERNATLQAATNTIKTADREIAQLDTRMTEYKNVVQTNAQIIAEQKRAILKLQAANDNQAGQLAAYKNGVARLDEKLADAYNGIKRQNENIRELVAQRDDLVAKYNASIKDRNEVVAKYNDLVKQIEKQQAAAKTGSGGGGTSGP